MGKDRNTFRKPSNNARRRLAFAKELTEIRFRLRRRPRRNSIKEESFDTSNTPNPKNQSDSGSKKEKKQKPNVNKNQFILKNLKQDKKVIVRDFNGQGKKKKYSIPTICMKQSLNETPLFIRQLKGRRNLEKVALNNEGKISKRIYASEYFPQPPCKKQYCFVCCDKIAERSYKQHVLSQQHSNKWQESKQKCNLNELLQNMDERPKKKGKKITKQKNTRQKLPKIKKLSAKKNRKSKQ